MKPTARLDINTAPAVTVDRTHFAQLAGHPHPWTVIGSDDDMGGGWVSIKDRDGNELQIAPDLDTTGGFVVRLVRRNGTNKIAYLA